MTEPAESQNADQPKRPPAPAPQKRIVLKVDHAYQCPLFEEGDQMAIKLPGVDMEGSTAICTLALAKFLPIQQKIDCASFKLVLRQFNFRCPRPENPVRFEIEVQDLPSVEQGRTKVIGQLAGNEARSVQALKKIPVFRPLSSDALRQLLHMMRIEVYADGDEIIHKGQAGKAFYVVYRGEVEVIGSTGEGDGEGSETVVRVLRKGYRQHQRVLRYAEVVVARAAAGQQPLSADPEDTQHA